MRNNQQNKQGFKNQSNKGKQGKKDSKTKRVNYDNTREKKFDKDIEDISKTAKSNDVSWYATNGELLRSAASLPFSQSTGSRLPFSSTTINSVPGVYVLEFMTSLGEADLSAINAAKDSIFSYVVHANSRNTKYNAADLTLMIIAGMQVFCALAKAIRAYGTMRMFDQRNSYLPKALVAGMGFDYSDLQSNLGTMWFDINEFIARSQQIWIPNTMPVMDRWFWMNSNIYQDSASIKGQFYMYSQYTFWILDETNPNGTSIVNVTPDGKPNNAGGSSFNMKPGANVTWSQFKTVLNGMFNALLNSEDRGIMMGDVLKAYTAEKLYALNPITPDYAVVPVYDTEVLSQIENAVGCSVINIGYTQNPNTGAIEQAPSDGFAISSIGTNYLLPKAAVLNFHQKEDPTPEQIMVATRMMSLGTTGFPTTISGNVNPDRNAVGTEIALLSYMLYYTWSNGSPTLNVHQIDQTTSGGSLSAMNMLALTAFDWAPWQYRVNTPAVTAVGDDISLVIDYALGDYDNYTIIDQESLKKMHSTALYSEFGVPVI